MQIENVETLVIFIQIRRDEHAVQLAVKGKINGEIFLLLSHWKYLPGTMLFLKNTHFLIKAILIINSLVHERIYVCVCVNKFRKFSQIYFCISSLCGAMTLYRINMHGLQALPFCLC